MVSYGSNPGIPCANVLIQYRRITAFTPTSGELYWTANEELNFDGGTSTICENASVDGKAGTATPQKVYYPRDMYIQGFHRDEAKIYNDSSSTSESGQRTYSIITPFFMESDDISPVVMIKPKDSGTGGTIVTSSPITAETKSNNNRAQYSYFYKQNTNSPPKNQTNESKTSCHQYIFQNENGSRAPGILLQNQTFAYNQEFVLNLKLFQPKTYNDKEDFKKRFFLNEFTDKEKDYKELCRGPFVVFRLFAVRGLYMLACFTTRGNFLLLASEVPNGYIMNTKTVTPLTLSANYGEHSIMVFSIIKGLIDIASGIGEDSNRMSFPAVDSEFNAEEITDTMWSVPPIKIYHRGFSFGFNTSSIEYAYSNEEGDVTVAAQPDPYKTVFSTSYVESPIVFISDEQHVSGLKVDDLTVITKELTGFSNRYAKSSVKMVWKERPLSHLMFERDEGIVGNIDSTDPAASYMRYYRVSMYFLTTSQQKYVSQNYFGPKIYTIRTIARCKLPSVANKTLDISNNIISLTYNFSHEGYVIVRKTYNLTCLIPKEDYTTGGFPYAKIPRKGITNISWEKIARNPATIMIKKFYNKKSRMEFLRNKFNYDFVGICNGGSITYNHMQDTVALKCDDFLSLLERAQIANSPYYDGMSVPLAVGSLLERAGFSALGNMKVVNCLYTDPFVYDYVLPASGLFSNPAIKLENGTSVLEGIKTLLTKFFSKVIFSAGIWGNRPRFLIKEQPGWLFEPTNDLPLTKHFIRDGYTNIFVSTDLSNQYDDIFTIILGKKSIQVDVQGTGWGNTFSLLTMDRYTNKVIVVSKTNQASIRNMKSPDFLGYMRVYFNQKTALGGKSQARDYLNQMYEIASKPKTVVSFSAWGRDTVSPLDIIKVDNNKIRVTSVSGSINREQNQWMMEVTGENHGYWIPDDTMTNEEY